MSHQINWSQSLPNNSFLLKSNCSPKHKQINDLQESVQTESKQKLKAPYKIKRLNYVIRNTLNDLPILNTNLSQQKSDALPLLSPTRKSQILDNIRKIYHKGSKTQAEFFQPQYDQTDYYQNDFSQNYQSEKRYNIATLSFLSRMINNNSLKQQFYNEQNLFNMEFNQLNELQSREKSKRDTQFFKQFQRTMIVKPTNFLELNKKICCYNFEPQIKQNSPKIQKPYENLKKSSKQAGNISAIDRNMIIKHPQNIREPNMNWMFTTKSLRNPYKPEIYTDCHAN